MILKNLGNEYSPYIDKVKDKIVIVINGKGESGKDTLIESLKKFGIKSENISSIDPIKKMLTNKLLYTGEKTEDSRILLHEVKEAVDKYNDFTTRYVIDCITDIILKKQYRANIIFVHIGECYKIKLLKEILDGVIPIKTLLIDSDSDKSCKNDPRFGDEAEYATNQDAYDFYFMNHFSDDAKSTYINEAKFAKLIWNIFSTYTKDEETSVKFKKKLTILYDGSITDYTDDMFCPKECFNELRKKVIYNEFLDDHTTYLTTLLDSNEAYRLYLSDLIYTFFMMDNKDHITFVIKSTDEIKKFINFIIYDAKDYSIDVELKYNVYMNKTEFRYLSDITTEKSIKGISIIPNFVE